MACSLRSFHLNTCCMAHFKKYVLVLSQARLRAALNVVHLEEVFEDEKNVNIVMQQCTGENIGQDVRLSRTLLCRSYS